MLSHLLFLYKSKENILFSQINVYIICSIIFNKILVSVHCVPTATSSYVGTEQRIRDRPMLWEVINWSWKKEPHVCDQMIVSSMGGDVPVNGCGVHIYSACKMVFLIFFLFTIYLSFCCTFWEYFFSFTFQLSTSYLLFVSTDIFF